MRELGRVDTGDILSAHNHLREMLLIRKGSELFRLRSAADVINRLAFHNTGRDQVPGLIVMSLRGDERVEIVVLFNATTDEQSFRLDTGKNALFELHPILRESQDPVVRGAAYDAGTSTFVVPARTTAVFVPGN